MHTLKGFHSTTHPDLEVNFEAVTSAVKICIWKVLMAGGVRVFTKIDRLNPCPPDKLGFKWIASNNAWGSHMNIIKHYWLNVPNVEGH